MCFFFIRKGFKIQYQKKGEMRSNGTPNSWLKYSDSWLIKKAPF